MTANYFTGRPILQVIKIFIGKIIMNFFKVVHQNTLLFSFTLVR